ncbi:hypothetical protein EPR50_G00125130 [Scomber scombrus]|uniref:Uncharacterized protein n=1 Tax=Scomber scombrus TaxID=13677 RepID=A0AAV1N0C3_SCOSC
MSGNITCIPGNGTSCLTHSSSTGSAVGLTFLFLVLAIVIGLIVYKYNSQIRNMLQCGHRETQVKEDYIETPPADSHVYTTMIRDQSDGQVPIYENLSTRTTGHKRPVGNKRRSPVEPEEDMYMPCDLTDDAIYGNDPACSLSIHHDSQEEVYVVPDSYK